MAPDARSLRLLLPDRNWVIPGWIPDRRLTILTGTAHGKSDLALQLAAGITLRLDGRWLTSYPWAGNWRPAGPKLADQARVERSVIASWRVGYEEQCERLWDFAGAGMFGWNDEQSTDSQLLAINRRIDLANAFSFVDMTGHGPIWGESSRNKSDTSLQLTEAGKALRQIVERKRAQFLVIDSAEGALRCPLENRFEAFSFLSDWEAWASDSHCSILLLHHSPATWHRAAHAVLSLQKTTGDDPNACQFVASQVPWGANPSPLKLTRQWCNGHNEGKVCFASAPKQAPLPQLALCPGGAWVVVDDPKNEGISA